MKSENVLRALVEKNFTKKTHDFICKKIPAKINHLLSITTVQIMSWRTPIVRNRIIFLSFRGSYDCNPKWICEEIVRRGLPYQLYWTYKKKYMTGLEDFPKSVRLVRQGSLEFFRALCSSRIIIDNAILMSVLRYKKKKDQCLINTWHGSIGIKKIAQEVVGDKKWVKKALREGRQTDYLIVNSNFEETIFRDSYWKESVIWKFGHPRNDILFERDTERARKIREKIYKIYGQDERTKICLYAPTYRNTNDLSPYDIDYAALVHALETRFGGEWVIFTRFHFKIMKLLNSSNTLSGRQHWNVDESFFSRKIFDVNLYPDIQELMVCTEAAITDYSSWICEYMLTRRPGFLFATDVSAYMEHDRAFYYPLETLPLPIAENNEELVKKILDFDEEKYIKRCDGFLQVHGSVDDGNASSRVADKIVEIMGEA